MATVKISTRGAKRIRLGHLWVYRSDIRDTNEAEAGAIVRVVDDARNFVGQAFYSDRSQIALRFLTTRDEVIDREWWRGRLHACADRRAAIVKQTNAYRLVYSEGDLLSSLIIDVYDGHYVLETLSQGADRIQDQLVELLVDEFAPKSITELNDARVRQLEGLELRRGTVYVSEAGADRGPQAGSPLGVVEATGSYHSSRAHDPVATAPGSDTLDQIEINQ